ncbi:hypothetical protein CPC08DRAFT_818887 [Agrocybe pediades]|nr:hypothetical protein CPC08DRAFT_818887 [Agrocybe pediades]
MTKPIWTNLFWECERESFGALSLEKPIEMYTSDELERVVLSWKSMQVGWRTNDGVPSRQRTILMDKEWSNNLSWPLKAFRHLYLVPGGRWLLGFRHDGEVFYYDLESPDYEKKRILVPAYTKDSLRNDVTISVDISERLPIQSFKVAQSVHEHGTAWGTNYWGIKVWEVFFVFEGKKVTALVATCLKTIPVDPACDDSMFSISLRNEHLAIAVRYLYPTHGNVTCLQYVYILEWSDVVDGSLDYNRRVLYADEAQEIQEIHLLPNDKIFALAPPFASVYNFSSLQHTNFTPELRPNHSNLTPPSTCQLHSFSWSIKASIPYVSQHCVHVLSTMSSKTLHAITIPDNRGGGADVSTSPLVAKPLIPLPRHEIEKDWPAPYNLGIRHGVLYNTDYDTASAMLILLEYDPQQEFAPDYVPVVKTFPCGQVKVGDPDDPILACSGPILNILLDEGSGRVVVPYSGRFEVLDFALIHKYRSTS